MTSTATRPPAADALDAFDERTTTIPLTITQRLIDEYCRQQRGADPDRALLDEAAAQGVSRLAAAAALTVARSIVQLDAIAHLDQMKLANEVRDAERECRVIAEGHEREVAALLARQGAEMRTAQQRATEARVRRQRSADARRRVEELRATTIDSTPDGGAGAPKSPQDAARVERLKVDRQELVSRLTDHRRRLLESAWRHWPRDPKNPHPVQAASPNAPTMEVPIEMRERGVDTPEALARENFHRVCGDDLVRLAQMDAELSRAGVVVDRVDFDR